MIELEERFAKALHNTARASYLRTIDGVAPIQENLKPSARAGHFVHRRGICREAL
jgi:hypothetical protein